MTQLCHTMPMTCHPSALCENQIVGLAVRVGAIREPEIDGRRMARPLRLRRSCRWCRPTTSLTPDTMGARRIAVQVHQRTGTIHANESSSSSTSVIEHTVQKLLEVASVRYSTGLSSHDTAGPEPLMPARQSIG